MRKFLLILLLSFCAINCAEKANSRPAEKHSPDLTNVHPKKSNGQTKSLSPATGFSTEERQAKKQAIKAIFTDRMFKKMETLIDDCCSCQS